MLRPAHSNSASLSALEQNESSTAANTPSGGVAKGSEPGLFQRIFVFVTTRHKDSVRNNAFYLVLFIVLAWAVLSAVDVGQDLFPELDMAVHSQCRNPTQNWDGKIFDVPVWHNQYSDRPLHYNLHNERRRAGEPPLPLKPATPISKPVIVWATHHKTGTFLAKKLFAKVCARMQWCCIFYVTRDSAHLLNDALHAERVHALGHNQWIWHPRELNLTNYRFIHFYRHPFRKVVSGFNYHYDGTEAWTKKPLSYASLCQNAQRLVASAREIDGGAPCETVPSSPAAAVVVTAAGRGNNSSERHHKHKHRGDGESNKRCVMRVDRDALHDYCASTHLCETCCRKEHELDSPANLRTLDFNEKTFVLRSKHEYKFMCEHLGSLSNTSSVMSTFHTVPPERGVLIEAALDYYENLRMAHLVNQTVNDPHAINLDLDFLTSDFDTATMQLLQFLKEFIPKDMIASLHYDLKFYDLNNSPIYRWSMSNPMVNHVTQSKTNEGHGKTSKELNQMLLRDRGVMELYAPIFELMHAVVKKPVPPKPEQ